jgi:hypothetical protein
VTSDFRIEFLKKLKALVIGLWARGEDDAYESHSRQEIDEFWITPKILEPPTPLTQMVEC